MPPKKSAPAAKAPIEEHKAHAKEFLERPEHKVKPAGFPDEAHETDEAKD